MKRNKLFKSLNDIDEKIIEEAGEFKDFKKKKRFNPIEFIIPIAAAAVIMIIVLPTFLNRDTPSRPSQDIGERQDVIQEIKIFKAEEFDKASSDLLSVLNDEESLKVFNNVISTAQKQEGIADVTSPDYVFDIYYANDSKERLYLWLQEEMLGSFMKAEDTHTIYNFSEKTNRKLYDLIEQNRKRVPEQKDYNHLIKEPDYKNAQFRAELGTLFYETDERIGFSSSFGVFIYNIKTEKLEAAFRIDAKEAFGEDYFTEYRMMKDEENIEITAFSHQDVFSEYYYEYSLKDKNLYKVEAATKRKDIYPLPDEDRRMEAFYGSNWGLGGFIYNPIGSDKPLYPFKDLDIKYDEWSFKYNIDVDGTVVDGKDIEIDKRDFEITISEELNSYLSTTRELNEKESLGNEYQKHLKIIGVEPTEVVRTDGTVITAFIYKFEGVPEGAKFKLEISNELQEKLALNNNIVNIHVK